MATLSVRKGSRTGRPANRQPCLISTSVNWRNEKLLQPRTQHKMFVSLFLLVQKQHRSHHIHFTLQTVTLCKQREGVQFNTLHSHWSSSFCHCTAHSWEEIPCKWWVLAPALHSCLWTDWFRPLKFLKPAWFTWHLYDTALPSQGARHHSPLSLETQMGTSKNKQ